MGDGTRGGSNDATLDLIATDELTSGTFSGQKGQVVKLGVGANGAMEQVDATNPLPVQIVDSDGNAAETDGFGSLSVSVDGVTSTFPLPTGAATEATLDARTGSLTEAAPGTDTASSGINGRLQRIAQRLTSLIAVFNIGPGTETAAVRVTLPTDGTGKVNAAQSGTWTVQPGNTANTTAWKVDGSAVTQPVDGAITATGNVAHDAADSGNPVKIGGKAMSSTPSDVTANDRVDGWFTLKGSQTVNLRDGSGNEPTMLNWAADGVTSGFVTAMAVLAQSYQYNGTNTEIERGNVPATILASAARTASVDSADQTNYNGRGLHLVIDVTAIVATPSVVFTIQGKDPLSGKYYTILASAAITGTGTTVLRAYPGLTAAANLVANDVLPRVWRVSAAHGDADSITYSVGSAVIL